MKLDACNEKEYRLSWDLGDIINQKYLLERYIGLGLGLGFVGQRGES